MQKKGERDKRKLRAVCWGWRMAHGRHMTVAELASLSEGEEKERKKGKRGGSKVERKEGKDRRISFVLAIGDDGFYCRERGCEGGDVRREGRVAVGGPLPSKSLC